MEDEKYVEMMLGKVLCSGCKVSGVCEDSKEKVVLCSEYLSLTQNK